MDSKITALGLEPEIAAKVEEVFKEILKDSYIPIARFNEVNDAKKALETTVADRDKQLAELGSAQGVTDDLKKQIEKLQAQNVKDKEAYEASIKQIQTDKWINDALLETGILDAKYIPAVKAYLPSVDITSEDSKLIFTTKLGEVKTSTLPTMFKSAEPPKADVEGFHPTAANTAPASSVKDDGSYASYLAKNGYNIQ